MSLSLSSIPRSAACAFIGLASSKRPSIMVQTERQQERSTPFARARASPRLTASATWIIWGKVKTSVAFVGTPMAVTSSIARIPSFVPGSFTITLGPTWCIWIAWRTISCRSSYTRGSTWPLMYPFLWPVASKMGRTNSAPRRTTSRYTGQKRSSAVLAGCARTRPSTTAFQVAGSFWIACSESGGLVVTPTKTLSAGCARSKSRASCWVRSSRAGPRSRASTSSHQASKISGEESHHGSRPGLVAASRSNALGATSVATIVFLRSVRLFAVVVFGTGGVPAPDLVAIELLVGIDRLDPQILGTARHQAPRSILERLRVPAVGAELQLTLLAGLLGLRCRRLLWLSPLLRLLQGALQEQAEIGLRRGIVTTTRRSEGPAGTSAR